MRSILTTAVLLFFAFVVLQAQQPQVADSTLPSGTHVRFWSHDTSAHGWLEGTVLRFYPDSGHVCLGVHSDVLHGFVSVQRIDSLQVAVSTQSQPPSPGATPAIQWRNVSVVPLRARETGCTS
jgi:hypothetical protein